VWNWAKQNRVNRGWSVHPVDAMATLFKTGIGLLLRTAESRHSQRFSIGFRPGLYGAQSNTLKLCDFIHHSEYSDIWTEAKSC
ncbi:6413_t:CDS:2, partial [Gigaspora margarita]